MSSLKHIGSIKDEKAEDADVEDEEEEDEEEGLPDDLFDEEGDGQIVHLDLMVTSQEKTIEKLKHDIKRVNATLKKVYTTNKYLNAKAKHLSAELVHAQKFRCNYIDRREHFRDHLDDLNALEENKVSFFCFRRKKEEKRKEMIKKLRDRIKGAISREVEHEPGPIYYPYP